MKPEQKISENNMRLLPLALALVNGWPTFAAAKAKNQPRQGLSRMRLLCLEANKQSTNPGAMRLSRKEKQMKTLATNHGGFGAAQYLKSMAPTSVHHEKRIPMNRNNCRTILSLAAVVMAGLALASPQPASAQYTFTTLDFPGSTSTEFLGATAQTIVGDFADEDGNMHGLLLSAVSGKLRQYDVPGAWFTSLSAINHRGQFGGVYRDDPAHPARRRGFVVMNGALTTIDYPGSSRTSIVRMNDRGQAVGIGRIPSEGATTPYGFIWQNGMFTDVSFPGAFGTGLDGINQQGDVCGFTTDEAGGLSHAMMRVNGIFSHVEPPGALDSIALSINDLGQVAGWYDDALGNTHGFLYYQGVFTTIDPPGSLASDVTTVDDNGVIVGDYVGTDGIDHGFMGTPIH